MAPSCGRRGERQRLAPGGFRHNLPFVFSQMRLVCGLDVASKGSSCNPCTAGETEAPQRRQLVQRVTQQQQSGPAPAPMALRVLGGPSPLTFALVDQQPVRAPELDGVPDFHAFQVLGHLPSAGELGVGVFEVNLQDTPTGLTPVPRVASWEVTLRGSSAAWGGWPSKRPTHPSKGTGCARTPRSLPFPNVSLEGKASAWWAQAADPVASSDVLTFLQELLRDLPTRRQGCQLSKGQRLQLREVAGHTLPCCAALPSSAAIKASPSEQLPALRPLGLQLWKKEATQPSDKETETGALACWHGACFPGLEGQARVMGRQKGGWGGRECNS